MGLKTEKRILLNSPKTSVAGLFLPAGEETPGISIKAVKLTTF